MPPDRQRQTRGLFFKTSAADFLSASRAPRHLFFQLSVGIALVLKDQRRSGPSRTANLLDNAVQHDGPKPISGAFFKSHLPSEPGLKPVLKAAIFRGPERPALPPKEAHSHARSPASVQASDSERQVFAVTFRAPAPFWRFPLRISQRTRVEGEDARSFQSVYAGPWAGQESLYRTGPCQRCFQA